jgi:hypothetical protein
MSCPPSSPTLLPQAGEGSLVPLHVWLEVFVLLPAGEAIMPAGAFYGQEGGELASWIRASGEGEYVFLCEARVSGLRRSQRGLLQVNSFQTQNTVWNEW